MNRDINDRQTRGITIRNCLNLSKGLACDALFVFIQDGITQASTNDFTHCGLRSLHHDVVGCHVIKQIFFRVANAVLDSELHIDHVFIFGQHERVPATHGLSATPYAHGHLTNLGQINNLMGFKWIG